MNKDKFGPFSITICLISIFYLIMYTVDGRKEILVDIFISVLSVLAIYFGVMTFIKKGRWKVPAIIGIIIGSFCLMMISIDLFFPEKKFPFKPSYRDVSFLGNSNIVGLRYCNSYYDCFVKFTYDVSTQKFSKQEANNKLDTCFLSRDGRKVLFVDGSESEKNIFIMNTDGSEKRQLTYSSDKDTVIIKDNFYYKSMKVKANTCPSFSPDGKRVIFVRYTFMRKGRSGVSNPRNCDIYEVDLETGNELKLTNYNFDSVSCPHYLSDGKRFIFNGYNFKPEVHKAYHEKYKGNTIFIMDKDHTELKPAIIHSFFSDSPSISFDDKIVYIANSDDVQVHNRAVFIKEDEKIKRLAYMKSNIGSPEISSDGKWVVFVESRKLDDKSYAEHHFWIINSDGTDLKEIIPPNN